MPKSPINWIPKQQFQVPSPVQEEDRSLVEAIKSQRSTEITFRLSKHVDGPFPGLWELAVMNKDGSVDEVISDADMLQYCLDNLHQVLENRGL